MSSESSRWRLGWKELGGVVVFCVTMVLLNSTLSPHNGGTKTLQRTTNFVIISEPKTEQPSDTPATAMTPGPLLQDNEEHDPSASPKGAESEPRQDSNESDVRPESITAEEEATRPVEEESERVSKDKTVTTAESEGGYRFSPEENPFIGNVNAVPTAFELLSLPNLVAIKTSHCSSCEGDACKQLCQFQEALQNELNATSGASDDHARLFVIPIDLLVWLKQANQRSYRQALQTLVKSVKAQSHYRTFKGSDHIFVCLSDGCQDLGEELAESLSSSLGTRAIFAGVDADGNSMKWPCPLRVISLNGTDIEDAASAAKKVVQKATFMIERRNRWICSDAAHPANHWDGSIGEMNAKGAYMKKYGFSICAIPKCGSSMTIVLLRRMMGYKNWNQTGTGINHGPSSGIKYVSKVKIDERKAINEDASFVRAIIVRHPISRLLSGYLDKIRDKRQFGRLPGVKKCMQHRGNKLSFASFVPCLIRKHPNPDRIDQHFRTQSAFCNVRRSELDFVGKQSSLAEDMKEFGQSLSFWEEYGAHGWGENGEHAFGEKSDQSRAHNSSSKIWEHYTEDLVRKVYKYYKEDFDRFGFSIDEILETKP